MVDLDEFMWSPKSTNFVELLKLFKHLGQIQVNHTIFGSNGLYVQPKDVVPSFLKRIEDQNKHGLNYKYFVQGAYKFSSLNVHHATFEDIENEKSGFQLFGSEWWILNHYCCQSREFWEKIKCTRGDADNYSRRTNEHFNNLDFNDIEDCRLFDQNNTLGLYSSLGVGIRPPLQPH
ncbi:hypothetical protein EBU71_19445 [bacterium]|nr:hypothetical protein [Candidatus Elulimicrobium humile]